MPITWSYGLSGGTPGSPVSGQSGGIGTGGQAGTTIANLATIALDPVTGDVAVPIYILRGPACVVQKVRVRFQFFLGEWFLDQRLGVPYYRDVLVKNPDPVLISAVFRKVLLTTPGVLRVASFSATLDRPSRTLTVDFQAVLVDNNTIISATAEPFIINP